MRRMERRVDAPEKREMRNMIVTEGLPGYQKQYSVRREGMKELG